MISLKSAQEIAYLAPSARSPGRLERDHRIQLAQHARRHVVHRADGVDADEADAVRPVPVDHRRGLLA